MPISGNPRVDNDLTGHYLFSDPEGDADASTFQWYRFADDIDTNTSEANKIVGATSITYRTVDPTDIYQWLRIQVTPMDILGATGTPILSAALQVIGATDNQPPSASFPPTGYWVQGAGNAAVDGYYTESTIFYVYPRYLQVAGSYILFEFWSGDVGFELRRWQLDTTLPPLPATPPFAALNTIPYYGPNPGGTTPTEGTWFAGAGASPAPTVLRVPISGNPTVGNTLTGHYLFSDPEGDADASTYQWYRFANGTDTTGGTAIPGATSISYTTIDPDDKNQWLRIEVTPMDYGLTGTPVLSDALKVISGT